MKAVRDAMVVHMLGTSGIASAVSTFRGQPAIFARSPIPPSAAGTYIVVRDSHIDDAFESKWGPNDPADYVPTKGRSVEHDIGVYTDQEGDSSALEELAISVRNAFHRVPISVSGYGVLIAAARGPIEAPFSESVAEYVDGRIITVALTLISEP